MSMRQLYYVPTYSRNGDANDRRRRNHHHRGHQAHGGGYVRTQPQQRQGGGGRYRPNLGTGQKDIEHHRNRSGAKRPPVPPATRGDAPNNYYLPATNVPPPPGPNSGSAEEESSLPTYPGERDPPPTATAVIHRDPPAAPPRVVNGVAAPIETQQQQEGLHVTRWSLSRVLGITIGASFFSVYAMLLFFAHRRRRRHGPIIKGDNDNDSDKETEEVSSTKSSIQRSKKGSEHSSRSKKSGKRNKEDEDIQRAIAATEAMLSMGSSSSLISANSGSKAASRTKEEKIEEGGAVALDLAIKQANEKSQQSTKARSSTPDDMLLRHQLPSGSPPEEDETQENSGSSPMMDSIRDLLNSTNGFVTGDLSAIQEGPSGAETGTSADDAAEDNVVANTWANMVLPQFAVPQLALPQLTSAKPDTGTAMQTHAHPLYVETTSRNNNKGLRDGGDVQSEISSLGNSNALNRLPAAAASSRSYRKTTSNNKPLARPSVESDYLLSTGNFFTIGKAPTAQSLHSSPTATNLDDDDDFVEEPDGVSIHPFSREDDDDPDGEDDDSYNNNDAGTLESSDRRDWMSNLRLW